MAATTEQLRDLSPLQLLGTASLAEASQSAELIDVTKDSVIFKRGDKRDLLHWLITGTVDMVDENFDTTTLNQDQDKPLEQALIYKYTAIATSNCQVIVLPQDTLDLIMTIDQASVEQSDDDWMTRLLSSRIFAFVPPANIQALFQNFSSVNFGQGDQVIRQGDSGDYFYVIKRGEATIDRELSDGTKHLKKIGPGDYFGEDALVSDKKRNATITMLTSGELMRLGKDEFNSLLVDPVSEYVTLDEIKAVIAGGEQKISLIDVRHPSEIEIEIVPGTKNIPLQLLRQEAQRLNQETVYVIATPGRRAELGALVLTQAGFDSYILKDV